MSDYEVGYGKLPPHSRFKKGVSGNPRGRPKPAALDIGERIQNVLTTKVTIRNQDRSITSSRLELAIKRHIAAALKGDLGAANRLLRIRREALKRGGGGPYVIGLVNSPDIYATTRQSKPAD